MKKFIHIINLIRIYLYVIIHFKQLRKNVRSLRNNITDEKECFVIGNGPSLTAGLKEHREKVLASKKICVNDMILTPIVKDIHPEYYILLDPLYFANDASPFYIQLGKDIVKALESIVTWNMILFIPDDMRNISQFNNIPKVNSHITLCYFNSHFPGTFPFINHYLYNHDFCSPRMQNVMVAAIFLMLRMHYKRIYLLGADHSWIKNLIVTDDNTVCYKNNHFYDPTVEAQPFYKGDAQNSVFSMSEILHCFSLMFEGYDVMNKYATSLESEIINATPDSYIDAFKKTNKII